MSAFVLKCHILCANKEIQTNYLLNVCQGISVLIKQFNMCDCGVQITWRKDTLVLAMFYLVFNYI